MDAPGRNAVGGTYVGNPVAQAAALAVLDVIDEECLLDRAVAIGETMRARMHEWHSRFPEVGDVRGLGAMLAIELVHDRESKDPAPELVAAVCEEAFRNGLLLMSAGIYSNVVRVLVPLTIADGELDEALEVWERALDRVLAA
jgi:4-aminobutyrate aminotransferase/(S)-3-amino-2-methylpropionate transaminase